MIIGDLDVMCTIITPFEANSILILDSHAVLATPASRELLQTKAGKREISKATGRVQQTKLDPCSTLNGLKSPAGDVTEKLFGLLVPARLDHRLISILCSAYYAARLTNLMVIWIFL
jgi:hypothetical protein